MKNILITNNQLHQLGGSELVALELAAFFLNHGWNVTLYSNLYIGGLASEISELPNRNNLRIIENPSATPDTHFDLLWIHHNLIPPTIVNALATKGIYSHIIWHHMSPFIHMELPLYACVENKITDFVTSISEEIDNVITEHGIDPHKIVRFDNPAPDIFSTYRKQPGQKIQSLLVVTNHLVDELKKAIALLKKANIRVDHYGTGGIVEKITPEILIRYDAVVTIAKTVQYALSVGIPVYEYDHFGGCGWITEQNYRQEARYNFSGRSERIKKEAIEIVMEIVKGYKNAADFMRRNTHYFADKYKLSHQLTSLFNKLPAKPTKKQLPAHLANNFIKFMELHRGLYRELTYFKHTFGEYK